MRHFVVLMAVSLAAAPLAAQTREDPSLAFTISFGMTTGTDLWRIENQPLTAPAGTCGASATCQDTVTLARRTRPGVTASLGMSFYRSPHFGLNAEVAYFGLGSEQTCLAPASGYSGGPNTINAKACTNAHGQHEASSAIGFLVGATYRILDPTKVQLFVRGNAGVGLLSNSFIQTVGVVHDSSCTTADNVCPYQLLSERSRQGATFMVSLSAGLSYYLGPGYRVRMEGRDLILTLPTAGGPGVAFTDGNYPPIVHTVKHIAVFTIGFDVLLERRHTRRY